MNKYLIIYATKTGTTKQVAERIQAGLEKCAIAADLVAVETAGSLDGYTGFILGSPVNGMRPLPAFTGFMTANQPALSGKVFGVFILSYIYQVGRAVWKKRVDSEIARIQTGFNPGQVAVFGARMTSKMPGFIKALFGIPKQAPEDNRDWAAIDAWTDRLATNLKK